MRDSIAAYRADIANAARETDDFDARHGTETGVSVFPWDAALSREEQAQAIVYMASDQPTFREMLCATGLADEDFPGYVFVDIGAGKGRVALMAAEYPFESVVGLELSLPLIEQAQSNVERCHGLARRCATLRFAHGNAARFLFPHRPLVLYFYHPFTVATMKVVMANLVSSLRAFPREAYILYRQPLFGRKYPDDCLAAQGVFRKIAEQAGCRQDLRNPWTVWHHSPSLL